MTFTVGSILFKVAVKNNVDVFYFACLVPIHVLFTPAGEMEKMVFLATWKDIPAENEQQFVLSPLSLDAGEPCFQIYLRRTHFRFSVVLFLKTS